MTGYMAIRRVYVRKRKHIQNQPKQQENSVGLENGQPKKKNSKLVPRLILATIFLTGLGVFFYPTISNYLLERSQTMVINEYQSSVEQIAEQEKSELKEQINEYNNSLDSSTLTLSDPFSEEEVTSGNAVDAAGNSVFDVMLSMLGESIATLSIPKINLEAPIYQGTSENILQKGIGLNSGSSIPLGGQGTHAVLTGHRGLPTAKLFTDLPELVIGDKFYIETVDEKLAYEVDQILTVEPDDTDALSIDPNEDYVTLVTCTPYMVNSHRLFVRGHRIPYTEDDEESEDVFGSLLYSITYWNSLKYAYLILVGAAVVIILYFILCKWRKRYGKGRKTNKEGRKNKEKNGRTKKENSREEE